MHGAERPVVARVHRLQHVESLRAANLADDDAVGPHAQRVPHKLADRDLSLALDVLWPCFEPQHMPLVKPQLGGVLDRDDSVGVRNRGRQRIQERRLPGSGAARDQDVQFGEDAALEKLDRLGRERAEADHVSEVVAFLGELADRHEGPAQRERRDHRVDAAAVGQAGVHERRRLVDPPADLGDDLVDDPPQMRLVGEADGGLVQTALTLHPDVERSVDHDLGHALVGEKALERAVTEDVVADLAGEPLPIVTRDALLTGEVVSYVREDPFAERVRVHVDVEELRSEVADDRHMDVVLELRERVLPERG